MPIFMRPLIKDKSGIGAASDYLREKGFEEPANALL
jgi:hypothetical protein